MIEAILSGLLGSYLFNRLVTLVRPKRESRFDSLAWEELKARNNWIEVCGSAIFGLSFITLVGILIATETDHSAWRIGFHFCFPIALFLIFVALVTLPRGVRRFREFWRFHELKHRTRLAILLWTYAPLAILGVVSGLKVFI